MPRPKPTVVVTALEYRKAEPTFVDAHGLECLSAPDTEAELAAAIRDAQASYAIVGARPYSGALYEALPRGGVIARFGVGHDGIDKAKATAAGLLCTNTPGVLNRSVAEHTMLLVGAASRQFVGMSARMSRGTWEQAMGQELSGKTLTVVGCGGIGREVARIAAAGYDMRIVGCVRPGAPMPSGLEHFAEVTDDFAAAVRGADFVSLHMSATRENRGWLGAARLALLGERTWLINTARGSLVDEESLFAALVDRRIAGAALDVFEREPYEPSSSAADLRSLPNVILTPHVGSNTVEANRRMAERALQNVLLAAERQFARMDLLNPEVLTASQRQP